MVAIVRAQVIEKIRQIYRSRTRRSFWRCSTATEASPITGNGQGSKWRF